VIPAASVHTLLSVTTGKQIHMVMRDMLFINWAVEPGVVRNLIDERLELDTKTGADGREVAFVSAVCFHVTDLHSGVLPLPNLSFEQVNYRTYVRADSVPAVCFLEMKVNSRMITALTSFLSVPVHYEDIEITSSAGKQSALGYKVRSGGLQAEAVIRPLDKTEVPNGAISPTFITDRFVGYASAGNAMYRINVEQPGLDSVSALIENVRVPSLERLGLLTEDQSARPYSALYVSEALFGADIPVREW
jgi:uncharacterized protein YqjF (DUF2071 family)